MGPDSAVAEQANAFLKPKGLKVSSVKILQNLWAGYGQICHVQAVPVGAPNGAKNLTPRSFILKLVAPPAGAEDRKNDEGHHRKLISYKVENFFYSHLAPLMPKEVAVAKCIGSVNERDANGKNVIALLISDLRGDFPVAGEKRGELSQKQVYAALDWLATFHGFWWKRASTLRDSGLKLPPLEEIQREGVSKSGVWLNGGYTYLATRRKEYTSLQSDSASEWSTPLCHPNSGMKNKSVAELVAEVLSPPSSPGSPTAITGYETLIHGDVKSENLFSNDAGSQVAFYDFQYVGLGLGVSDLAKLFTCSVPQAMLTEDDLGVGDAPSASMAEGESKLLEYYQRIIQGASGMQYPWEVLVKHWETALVDWLRFQASWGFWGNTEWLEARARHILQDEAWISWLSQSSQ